MISKYMPADWVTMQEAIYDWVASQVASDVAVVWSAQNAPSPAKPMVRLHCIVPPVSESFDEERNRGIAFLVDTVADETDYTITINGVDHTYTSGIAATALQIRNGLIAVCPLPTFVVSDSAFAIIGTASTTYAFSNNLVPKIAQEYLGDSTGTFSIDILAEMDSLRAVPISKALEKSLEKASVREALNAAGWAVIETIAVRKPDQVVGGQWEERCGFDVRLGCRSRTIDLIDFIESAGTIIGSFGY